MMLSFQKVMTYTIAQSGERQNVGRPWRRGCQCRPIGRRRRSQFVHGKRAGPGAYLMYVRSTSPSRGQNDK
ncbi:hypothetical protein AL479_23175 [Citrobacter amalonaticus]|nr:hypothetical protein AL479_23175 [Citrobacter amalonaticus]